MAKNDITPANPVPRKHEQKRGRGYRVSIIRTPCAGIFVCHSRREFYGSRSITVKGSLLSRKIDKISTAKRVLRRIQRCVPDAYLAIRESFIGAVDNPFKEA